MQNGRSIAEQVYELARQWGYQGAAPANGGAPANGNGARNQQKLNQAQKGQSMQGLSRVPTTGSEAATNLRNLSPSEIADMKEDVFMRLLSDPNSRRDLEYAMAKADSILEE
jgi:hypothetical protein